MDPRESADRPESFDVVLCTDRGHFVGVAPVLRSILANSAESPSSFRFHFVVGHGESAELGALLRRAFPQPAFRHRIAEFRSTPFLDDYIRAGEELTYAAHASSVMNFARFYLHEIFPDLERFAYLDADLIVRGDLAELFRLATLEHHDLAAVQVATLGTWDGFEGDPEPLRELDPDAPVFNNGIYVSELGRWRRKVPELERWMGIHRRSMEDFVFGTQSIMNLAFHHNVEILPREWNVRPLGCDENVPPAELEAAKILHWAGERKPWREDGLYKSYWLPWASREASDREATRS